VTTNPQAPNLSSNTKPGNRSLQEAALWATPAAGMHNDGENPETFRARQAELRAKGMNGNGAGTPLSIQAKELAGLWPPPAERDHRFPNSSESQQRINEGSKRGQQLPNFVAHTHGVGQTSSAEATASSGALNPEFVCWLMGYPKGWLG
jgi:hypothetical protein